MDILFFLLKIILLVLLGIVLFILVILGILLFSPVYYEIYFEKYEEMAYEIRFRYLRWIRGYFVLDHGKKESEVYAFWKLIFSHKEKKTDIEEPHCELDEPAKVSPLEIVTEKIATNKEKVIKKEPVIQPEKKLDSSSVKCSRNKHPDKEQIVLEKETKTDIKTRKSKSEKQSSFDWKLLFQKQSYTFIKECLILIRNIVRVIAPVSWDFELVIGRDDPADTGECIAKLTMLYPLYYRHGIIRGDYERKCLEGGFVAEGKFRLIRLVICFIRFILKDSVRKVISLFLKDRKER